MGLKNKVQGYGTIERKKARLVIQGCNQKKGVEYTQTYAPVAKVSTLGCGSNEQVAHLSNGCAKCFFDWRFAGINLYAHSTWL